MTFYGKPRGDHHAHDHAHEARSAMLIPLGVLALGAVFAGMIWYNNFFGDEAKMRDWFWHGSRGPWRSYAGSLKRGAETAEAHDRG